MILRSHGCTALWQRVREQLHSGRQWRQGEPATYSSLAVCDGCSSFYRRARCNPDAGSRGQGSAGAFSKPFAQTRVAEPAGRRAFVVMRKAEALDPNIIVPGRHVGASGRRPGSTSPKFQNRRGPSSPAMIGVRCGPSLRIGRLPFSSGSSAGVASGLARGWCWSPTKVRAEPAKSARYGGDILRELPPTGSLARHTHYHPSSRRADVLEGVVFHAVAPIRVEPASSARTVRLDSRNRAFASASACSSPRTSQRSCRECATTSQEITTDRRAQFVPRSG